MGFGSHEVKPGKSVCLHLELLPSSSSFREDLAGLVLGASSAPGSTGARNTGDFFPCLKLGQSITISSLILLC